MEVDSRSRAVRRGALRFDGVKVFSATLFEHRARLGEVVTEWLAAHSHLELVELVVTQSSDSRFHCLAISVFYRGSREAAA